MSSNIRYPLYCPLELLAKRQLIAFSDNDIENAVEFIEGFTSFAGRNYRLTNAAERFLRQTVKRGLTIYRGLALFQRNVDDIHLINELKVGDNTPFDLQLPDRPYANHSYTSYSTKLSIAKKFAKGVGGKVDVELVIGGNVPASDILCVLANLRPLMKTLDKEWMLEDRTWKYIDQYQEVIIDEPIDTKVIYKKGMFNVT